MENLAKAIINVMKAVKNIEKSMTVGSGSSAYSGVSDKDVKEIIGKAMTENGLCILPLEITPKTQIDRWEETSQYGNKVKQSVFTEVTTKYLLLHESGESQVISGYGHGIDSQDKGAGKATTYALKNAVLYTFFVPTGKLEDTDKHHSDDLDISNKTNIITSTAAAVEMRNVENRKQMFEVWNKYPQHQNNEVFKNAASEMKIKYPAPPAPTPPEPRKGMPA